MIGPFPATYAELLRALTTDVVFLGAIVYGIMFALGWFMERMWPGNGYRLPENWTRLISWVLPFVVAFVALELQVVDGLAVNTKDAIYQLVLLAGAVALGKQAWYIGERGVKALKKGINSDA